MGTVAELAKIAREAQSWINEHPDVIPTTIRRKVELMVKAIIEYEMLLNHMGLPTGGE